MRLPRLILITAWCFLLLIRGTVFGQAPSPIEGTFFRVVITENDKPLLSVANFHDSNGRLIIQGMPLRNLIAFAFEREVYQVVGGPDWLDTSHLYDIMAQPPPAFVDADEKVMLKALLRDRFNLDISEGQQEVDALVLKLGGGDLKISAYTPGSEESRPMVRFWKDDGTLNETHSTTLDRFASVLAVRYGKPVVNQTGLDGHYTFSLFGVRIENMDDFAEILRQQAGLVLEPGRALSDVLEVNGVSRPRLDD